LIFLELRKIITKAKLVQIFLLSSNRQKFFQLYHCYNQILQHTKLLLEIFWVHLTTLVFLLNWKVYY